MRPNSSSSLQRAKSNPKMALNQDPKVIPELDIKIKYSYTNLQSLINHNRTRVLAYAIHRLVLRDNLFRKNKVAVRKKAAKSKLTVLTNLKMNSVRTHVRDRKLIQLFRMFGQIRTRRLVKSFGAIVLNGLKSIISSQRQKSQTTGWKGNPDSNPLSQISSQTSINQTISMALSQDVKQALKKMQRFDRYVYAQNSERILKDPIEKELRRIQRLKNGRRQLRDMVFDNELTVTCLTNHVKLIGELNRELNNFANIKLQKQEIQNRIIETNVEMRRQMKEREAKTKENSKFMQILISGLQDSPERGRKLINAHIRAVDGDKKVLGELIVGLLSASIVTSKSSSESADFVYSSNLTKLHSDISAIDKKIASLQRDKTLFDQKVTQASSGHLSNAYSNLSNIWTHFIKLNQHVKDLSTKTTGNVLFSTNQKQSKYVSDDKSPVSPQELLLGIELDSICQKITKGEEWISDLEATRTKFNRRPSHSKSQWSKNFFMLINQLVKNTKDLKTLRDIVLSKQQQLKLIQSSGKPQKSLLRVKSAQKFELPPVDNIKTEVNQILKLVSLAEGILDKRETQNKSELVKLKRTLQNKNRFSQLTPVISVCQKLVQIIISKEQNDRQKSIEDNKSLQSMTKQMNLIDNLFEKFDMMIESGKVEQSQSHGLAKVRKNLEQLQIKLGKVADSNLVSEQWQKILFNVVSSYNKLLTALESVRSQCQQQAKDNSAIGNSVSLKWQQSPPSSPKGTRSQITSPIRDETLQKNEVQQLKAALVQLQSRCKTLERDNQKLVKAVSEARNSPDMAEERRKHKLQTDKMAKVAQHQTKVISDNEQQLKAAYSQIQSLKSTKTSEVSSKEKETETLKSQLRKKESDIKQTSRESKKREDQLRKQLKQREVQLKGEAQKNSKLQQSIIDLVRSIKSAKDQTKAQNVLDGQQNGLLSEINRLKQQVIVLTGDVTLNKQASEAIIHQVSTKYQLENTLLKERVKELDGQFKEMQRVSSRIEEPQIPKQSMFETPTRNNIQSKATSKIRAVDSIQSLERKQLERRLNQQTQLNSSYLETIQRLSQKMYEKQVQVDSLNKTHTANLQEILDQCAFCLQVAANTLDQSQTAETVRPIHNAIQDLLSRVKSLLVPNPNVFSGKFQRKFSQKYYDSKKVSKVSYQEPLRFYQHVDEIQYFGSPHQSITQEQTRLADRVRFLQKQRQYLYRRIKILSIFVTIGEPEKAFIHNLNCVIDRVFYFLIQSRDFKSLRLDYNYFMNFVEQVSSDVTEQNFINYFRAVQDFLKELLEYVFAQKAPVNNGHQYSDKGYFRGSSARSQMTEHHQRYELSMHSQVRARQPYQPSTLQSLLNEYLSTKNANVLTRIEEVLNSSTKLEPTT